jgi:O-antigen ligase
MDHFLSIFTPIINDEYSTLNYQGSVNDRLNWWSEIINKSFSTVKLFIIGNGFGMRVIDFSSVNILIREPHNMLLTIIARQGYFGLFLFMIIQFLFFKTFISKINLVKNEKDFNQSFKILLILFGYILITISMSTGTSILNKSGISIPYYLFWGMIIGYNKKLK